MELLNILVKDIDTAHAISGTAPSVGTADVSGCTVIDVLVQCSSVSGGASIAVALEQSQFSAGPWISLDSKTVTADTNLDFSLTEPPSGRYLRLNYTVTSGTMTVSRASVLGKGPV